MNRINPKPEADFFDVVTQADFDQVMGMAKSWSYVDPQDPPTSIYPRMFVATKGVEENVLAKPGLAYCPILVPFNEHHEKQAAMFAMGQSFFQQKLVPVAVAFAAETWMGSWSKKGGKARLQPRDDPNRQEFLTVFGSTINKKFKALWNTPIIRDDQDRISLGGPLVEEHDGVEVLILKPFFDGFFNLAMKQHIQQN
jgi:hypothetical protein